MTKAWDANEERIKSLYIGQKKSLNEVMGIMKEQHGFDAS